MTQFQVAKFSTKSVQTRKDNDKELANLLKVFARMPIDVIAPMHVRAYMDIPGQTSKVRANREKALFSHIFNKASEWGYTALQNPCQGGKRASRRLGAPDTSQTPNSTS